jgi:hypothetical protein
VQSVDVKELTNQNLENKRLRNALINSRCHFERSGIDRLSGNSAESRNLLLVLLDLIRVSLGASQSGSPYPVPLDHDRAIWIVKARLDVKLWCGKLPDKRRARETAQRLSAGLPRSRLMDRASDPRSAICGSTC